MELHGRFTAGELNPPRKYAAFCAKRGNRLASYTETSSGARATRVELRRRELNQSLALLSMAASPMSPRLSTVLLALQCLVAALPAFAEAAAPLKPHLVFMLADGESGRCPTAAAAAATTALPPLPLPLVRAGPRCDIAVGWRLLASSARSLRHRGPVFAGERYVAAVELVAGVGDVAPRFSAPREVLAVEADGSAERLAVTGRLGLGRAVRRRAGPCSESEQHQQGDGPPHLVVRGAATVSAAQKAGSKQRQEPTQYNRACRLVRFDF